MMSSLRKRICIFNKCCYEISNIIKKYWTASEDKVCTPYTNLLPTDDIDGKEPYVEALDWALQDKNIHNIALTGPYGSGKSSILKAYKEHNVYHNYLEISLSSFDNKDEASEEGKSEQSLQGAINANMIERGILKQLFYREKKMDLPYSRFRKIESDDGIGIKRVLLVVSVIIFGLVGKILIFPGTIYPRLDKLSLCIDKIFSTNEFLALGAYVLLFLGMAYFAYKYGNRLLHRIRVKEVSAANVSMKTDVTDGESVFDKYLDEILYVFEARKYDVVFIEDLDRFENTGIFIKLRELNNLINENKRIGKKVVFVYALLDDMFKVETERTKFFDFIIPVMPFINGMNTEGKLRGKITEIMDVESDSPIDSDFLKEISIYIKDMRMMNNICNEFYLYRKLHEKNNIGLKAQKILALIIYKNFCPEDFAKLQYNKGKVAETFKKKAEIIKEETKNLKDEVKELRRKIDDVEMARKLSVHEWKLLFLNAITNDRINEIGEIIYRNERMSFKDFLNDERNMLDDWENEQIRVKDTGYFISIFDGKITDFKDNKEYKRTLENIYKSRRDGIDLYQEKIKKKEMEIRDIGGYTLRNLINRYGDKKIFSMFREKDEEFIEQYAIIVYLLRNGALNDIENGYIDETYPNYLSYFYKGGISANDTNFILSIRNHESKDFYYQLNNVKRVVDELNEHEFAQIEALNKELLDYLLNNEEIVDKRKRMFDLLSNESEPSISFIRQYFDEGKNLDKFTYYLCNEWENVWNYISMQPISVIDLDRKDAYLKYILKNVPTVGLERLNAKGKLSEYISINGRIFYFADKDGTGQDKFINILKCLNVKFKEIISPLGKSFSDMKEEYADILNFIVAENHYEIEVFMITKIVAKIKEWDENHILQQNYTLIKESGDQNLIEYIDGNFKEYLNNVFFNLKNNQTDKEEYIIEMLTKNNIDNDLKERIISKEEFQVSDIKKVDKIFWNQLFEEKKIAISWDHLIEYNAYADFKVDSLIKFLNDENVYNKLENANKIVSKENMQSLIQVLLNPKSNTKMLTVIFKLCPYSYENLMLNNVANDQIVLLIKNNLLEYTKNNFEVIRKHGDEAVCSFIRNSSNEEMPLDIATLGITNSEIFTLLNLGNFCEEKNYQFILLINNDIDNRLAKKCIDILNVIRKEISIDLYKKLFAEVDTEQKLKLIISQLSGKNSSSVFASLAEAGDVYKKITLSHSGRCSLPNTNINNELLAELEAKGYISSYKVDLTKGIITCNRKKQHNS